MEHLIAAFVNAPQKQDTPFVEFISATIMYGRDYPFPGAQTDRELSTLRASIEQLREKELIAKIYNSFLTGDYPHSSMVFYVKTGRLILQHVRGDFSLSQAFNFAELSNLHLPADKLVQLVQKIFPENHTAVVQQLF